MPKMHPKSKLLTFIHLHRKATSRTVFSGNFMAILAYRITGASDAYLRGNTEIHQWNCKVIPRVVEPLHDVVETTHATCKPEWNLSSAVILWQQGVSVPFAYVLYYIIQEDWRCIQVWKNRENLNGQRIKGGKYGFWENYLLVQIPLPLKRKHSHVNLMGEMLINLNLKGGTGKFWSQLT